MSTRHLHTAIIAPRPISIILGEAFAKDRGAYLVVFPENGYELEHPSGTKEQQRAFLQSVAKKQPIVVVADQWTCSHQSYFWRMHIGRVLHLEHGRPVTREAVHAATRQLEERILNQQQEVDDNNSYFLEQAAAARQKANECRRRGNRTQARQWHAVARTWQAAADRIFPDIPF